MGRGIARNLLKNGVEVYVWNRTKSVSQTIEKEGAIVSKSPKEATKEANIVIEVTANDESSREVWLASDGILEGSDKDKILVTSATLSVAWVDELASICKTKNFRFLDMPLTGGRIAAETGTLTLLVGGDKNTLDEITPILNFISSQIYHLGSIGDGMRFKLILNFLQAVHIIGFNQAIQIAKKNNMNLEKVSKIFVENRPGGKITEIGRNAYFKTPDPITFSIEWLTKDLTYAKELAGNLDVSLLDDVLKIYKNGEGDRDWADVKEII